ncbi:hypothetical protein NMY22_g17848 [Coprinellus aureogranulatus]|nr:hypothetical protein NMY22_g17848 [Coprinellus aureogranulatus]
MRRVRHGSEIFAYSVVYTKISEISERRCWDLELLRDTFSPERNTADFYRLPFAPSLNLSHIPSLPCDCPTLDYTARMTQQTSGAPSLPNFNDAQKNHIRSQLPLFIEYLEQNNPTVADRHQGTSQWMADCAKKIMSHGLFDSEELGGRGADKAEMVDIRTFFRNWKNNTYKKRLGTTSSSRVATPTTLTTRAMDDAIRGLVILDGDLSARDLYLRERPEEYSRAVKAVKSEMPQGSPACAIAQKAMKRAWDTADHELWEKRKRELELDVKRNQTLWPEYLRDAIQQNLDRGIVGSALVGIVLYAGYDAVSQEEIKHMPKAHAEMLEHFVQHADVHLPNIKKPSIYQFERDNANYPLLPLLNINEVSLGQINEVLSLYLSLMWDRGYPADNAMPTIPWLAIANDPAAHYDVNAYSFGCIIGDPAPCSPIHAPSLYVALHQYQSTGNPFRFFPKTIYLSHAQDAARRLVDNLEQGDEVDEQNVTKETPVHEDRDGPGDSTLQEPATSRTSSSPSPIPVPALSTPTPPTSPPYKSRPATPPPEIPPTPATPQPPVIPHNVARSPPPPHVAKKGGKKAGTKGKSMKDTTNDSRPAVANTARRGSTRVRKEVTFGLHLVAGGQRSPQGRKPAWEYPESDSENQPPKKRARR